MYTFFGNSIQIFKLNIVYMLSLLLFTDIDLPEFLSISAIFVKVFHGNLKSSAIYWSARIISEIFGYFVHNKTHLTI